jgi:adenine-specific DNA-methyltransferase
MASVATMIGQPQPVPSPDGLPGAGGPPGTSGVPGLPEVVRRAGQFPRLRYMGSKYRLIPHLARAFTELGGATALDAFSGSGVVSYLLKTCGYQVTANDFLAFPAVIAQASVVNQDVTLGADDIAEI